MKEARYYKKLDNKRVRCFLCPQLCFIPDNGKGLCQARANYEGVLYSENYGKVTILQLAKYSPTDLDKKILRLGSYGCNLKCQFCNNFLQSQLIGDNMEFQELMPSQLIESAISEIKNGNIGIEFTYNEPLIGLEYVIDCCKLAKEKGLMTRVFTNGFIMPEPLKELLLVCDSLNIGIKGTNNHDYRKIGGSLDAIKKSIGTASKLCKLEVSLLLGPHQSSNLQDLSILLKWLGEIDREIPFTLRKFDPAFRMKDCEITSVETFDEASRIANTFLKNVYFG